MDEFIKVTACVLVTLVLYLAVERQSKEIALIAVMVAGVMVATMAMSYMQSIISFFTRLQSMGNFVPEYLSILLRCVCIGILAEIVSLICIDAGNAALGKMLQFAAGIIILWLSLPLFVKLIELVEEILLLA